MLYRDRLRSAWFSFVVWQLAARSALPIHLSVLGSPVRQQTLSDCGADSKLLSLWPTCYQWAI